MRTARLGLEGCESFVDDLIGCRVLYSVRDALLHRSLEIQPWHFPIRYFLFLFFLFKESCSVARARGGEKKNRRKKKIGRTTDTDGRTREKKKKKKKKKKTQPDGRTDGTQVNQGL